MKDPRRNRGNVEIIMIMNSDSKFCKTNIFQNDGPPRPRPRLIEGSNSRAMCPLITQLTQGPLSPPRQRPPLPRPPSPTLLPLW